MVLAWEALPWSRLQLNYMKNKMLLVITQNGLIYSQLLQNKLRTLFDTHGIPNSVVKDNATVFVSEEILAEQWNLSYHILAIPYNYKTA